MIITKKHPKKRPESFQLSESLWSLHKGEEPRLWDKRLQKTNVIWYFLSVFQDVPVRICEPTFIHILTLDALEFGAVQYYLGVA